MDLLAGQIEADGSVLEVCTSLEHIVEPGVDKGATPALGLVKVCLSTEVTNTGGGEVAPSPTTPVLVVATSILKGRPLCCGFRGVAGSVSFSLDWKLQRTPLVASWIYSVVVFIVVAQKLQRNVTF